LLAGVVNVVYAFPVITITGDASGNTVEITAGTNVGEYRITGIDTTINGPAVVVDPFNEINVTLNGGSDTFTIRGPDVSQKIVIPGNVIIHNGDGNDVNQIIDTRINGILHVDKIAGTSESTLEIIGSTVVGDTEWNANTFDGDSKTMITGDSDLQGNVTIDNYDGEDIFVIFASEIGGYLDIENRSGDTRTVFGIQEDPIVFGDVSIVNGNGNDKLIVHDTSVWGKFEVENNDGHTSTTVEQSEFGLGAPVGSAGDFEIDNGAGIDEFLWTDATVRDDLEINNHGNADGDPPPIADVYGSSTVITGAVIGNDLEIESDNGFDVITLIDTTVVDDFDSTFLLHDGGSEVTLIDSVIQENLFLDTGSGNDIVRFDNSTVAGDVDIELFDGQDVVEIVNGSRLLGSTRLVGGAGIDKFVRQLGPPADAVEIAFLAFEDLELDEFILA
jgi:hypothetical protein